MKTATPTTSTIDFVLLIDTPRPVTDDCWEVLDPADLATWEAAQRLFRRREYDDEHGRVCIEFDWNPLLVRLRQNYQRTCRVHDPQQNARGRVDYPLRPVRVPCTVFVTRVDQARNDDSYVASCYTESFLHDLFLMLNLATPGCCCLWRATLRARHQLAHKRQLALSEFVFDCSFMRNQSKQWPGSKFLDLKTVATWYDSVRRGLNQIPENRLQKVLFALLHICKTDMPVDTIIWLFYALETLFDTQPGENRRALTHRISLVLSPNDRQSAYLKRELRALYEIRSGLVHGGRGVAHPMNDEWLDKRVQDETEELMEASEFGCAVLVCSLQQLIERGGGEFNFEERLSAAPRASIGDALA